MRTATIDVYKFDELPTEAAKEKARYWWRTSGIDFAWSDESLKSIIVFCDEFGVKLTDYSVCPFERPTFRTSAENAHFRGRQLKEFKRENMPTGYCLDCALWETFYDCFKASGNAKGAFDSAICAGFAEWAEDMESQTTDEYIDDCLQANEYEFTENGKRFHHGK